MRLRIGDIGLGARHRLHQRVRVGLARRDHRRVELAEADRGEFAEEPGEIAEMMGRRGMRYAGLARHGAQRQARQPVALQHPLGGGEQGVVQIAVMIGRLAAGRRRRVAGLSATALAGLRFAAGRFVLVSRDVLAMRILIVTILTL